MIIEPSSSRFPTMDHPHHPHHSTTVTTTAAEDTTDGKEDDDDDIDDNSSSNNSNSGVDDDSDSNRNNNNNNDEEEDTILLQLIQNYDWTGCAERIRSCPDECRSVGLLGRTPLHVACDQDAPAWIIEALLRVYPEAVVQVGTSEMNPLHIVCSSTHASVDIVRLLLLVDNHHGHNHDNTGNGHGLPHHGLPLVKQMCSMRDVDGDTPLHSACRCGASLDVLKLLLYVHPEAVHDRDFEGLTPLLRLWVRVVVLLGEDSITNVHDLKDLTGELGEAWKKTMLLLYCAYLGSLRPKEPHRVFRPMHAVSVIDCPRRVVKIASVVYRDQLLSKDENGMTPLLLACQAPIYTYHDVGEDGDDLHDMLEDHLYEEEEDDEQEEEDGNDNGNANANNDNTITRDDVSMLGTSQREGAESEDMLVKQYNASVIDILMAAEPAAARIADPKGILPLQHALQTGKTWNQGIRILQEAETKAGNL